LSSSLSLFLPQGEITVAGSFEGGLSLRTQAARQGQHWPSLGGYSAAFLPQMQLFLAAVEGEGEEREKARGTARWALGEVMVAKALYKSHDTRKWEAVTIDNLL